MESPALLTMHWAEPMSAEAVTEVLRLVSASHDELRIGVVAIRDQTLLVECGCTPRQLEAALAECVGRWTAVTNAIDAACELVFDSSGVVTEDFLIRIYSRIQARVDVGERLVEAAATTGVVGYAPACSGAITGPRPRH